MSFFRRRTAEATEQPGWTVHAEYVKELVSLEETRKDSLEKRGLAVITTAGALVTLLFGLAALSTRKSQTFSLPTPAEISLAIGLGLFFVSACIAIATNVPLPYRGLDVKLLRRDLECGDWSAPVEAAAQKVTGTRLRVLEDATTKNGRKAKLLLAALAFEVLAVAAVAAAIGFVVVG